MLGRRLAGRLLSRSFTTSAISPTTLRPQHVGVLAMEVYFPKRCVLQKDLEVADGVKAGKYEIGLGQEKMAFTGDREDVNTICMTAVEGLLSKYGIDPAMIGRVEVGTETMIDKSKSTKTHLMEMFHTNTNVEGCTTLNACYGGTAALMNSVAWVESSAWDGRFAVVVCGDIAVYEAGPARPTGGCGAVAMLIGPDAPLPLSAKRHSHAEHIYDFYKPDLESEYPAVDGHLSNAAYVRALDVTYNGYMRNSTHEGARDFDFMCFHSPYNKLVTKAVGRCLYNDFVRDDASAPTATAEALAEWHPEKVDPTSTYADRALETALKPLSAPVYKAKCAPSAGLSKQIGNSYSGALYVNLAALCDSQRAGLEGKTTFMFSYGSGAIATAFSITARRPSDTQSPLFTCAHIGAALNLQARLDARTVVTADEFADTLLLRERSHSTFPYAPTESLETLAPGAFYIEGVDEKHRRTYARKPHDYDDEHDEPIAAAA